MPNRAPAGSPAPWLSFLVDALATYRLTRLATADVISEPVRMAVLRKTGAEPPPGEDDPTAQEVVESLQDPPRLATLVARPSRDDEWHWDIRLQGEGETVFFRA